MKFTLSWLKQHLETTATLTEICDKLTAIGLEVEGLEEQTALAPFVIAEILEAEKHPDADRLRVCKVNDGQTTLQIVCGAPNARKGLKTVLAHEGDVIPRSGEALKKGSIRGIESQGMMCSASELQIDEEASGIMELPADAPVGTSYAAYAGLNDPVIEINLTPNKGDCAGVRGIARDLAAAGLGTLKPQKIETHKTVGASKLQIKLDFADDQKQNCPLFVGRIIRNVKNGPSPMWLQRYLRAIGARPISALVDITNYLTYDSTRPFHVFDADKIKGHIRVYPAKGDEEFLALNGKTYKLEQGMTAIADDTGVISLGAVMGGESTGCQEDTVNILIESALFSPTRTAQTGRKLQINSDARYRFERGLDPAFAIPGAELATQLVIDFCGTPETVVEDLIIAGEVPTAQRVIAYRTEKCLKHIGVDVPAAEQKDILTRLGFVVNEKADHWDVTVPSWRNDVMEDADLTEEVIRIKGFDSIPAISMPRTEITTPVAIDLLDRRAGLARRSLASQGLMEAVTWSFMASPFAALFGEIDPALRLVNPISSDLDVMRSSIIGNLLLAAKRNIARGFGDVGLFEVGPTYHNNTPEGQKIVATLLRAGNTPRHWATPARPVDVYDIKADVMAALTAAGAPVDSLQITTDAPSYYHPGRSGVFRLGATVLAIFGEIHPTVKTAADVGCAAVGAEIFLAAIPQPRSTNTAKPLLKLEELQPVTRDFAFVVDRSVDSIKLVKAIKGADKNMIRDVTIFDVYAGDKIEADKKSVALSVMFQPKDHTLTESEIEAMTSKITAAVTKATGATLRS